MPRFLSFLLSGVLLIGATSCRDKGNEPEPAPELEGSWTAESFTVYSFDFRDILQLKAGPKPPTTPYRLDISSDSLIIYYTNLSTPYRVDADHYTRQGDTLVVPSRYSYQIKELTAHTLVLYYKGPPLPNGGVYVRSDIEDRFSR